MVPGVFLPAFLLADSVVRTNGSGAAIPVDPTCGPLLEITVGITRILEKESLHVSVWGSADGEAWQRLRAFPPKSYCGSYTLLLELFRHSDVRFLRVQWTMSRWSLTASAPLFGFYVQMKPSAMLAEPLPEKILPEKKPAALVRAVMGVA